MEECKDREGGEQEGGKDENDEKRYDIQKQDAQSAGTESAAVDPLSIVTAERQHPNHIAYDPPCRIASCEQSKDCRRNEKEEKAHARVSKTH